MVLQRSWRQGDWPRAAMVRRPGLEEWGLTQEAFKIPSLLRFTLLTPKQSQQSLSMPKDFIQRQQTSPGLEKI